MAAHTTIALDTPDVCQPISEETDICILCKNPFEDTKSKVIPTARGLEGINRASAKRGHSIVATEGCAVHKDCRMKYINKKYIDSFLNKPSTPSPTKSIKKRLRNESSFDSLQCLFCGQGEKWVKRGGLKVGEKLLPVRTFTFKQRIEHCCKERQDGWAKEVSGRMQYMQDLVAHEVVYHQICSVNFRTGKCIPKLFSDEPVKKKKKIGRPQEQQCQDAFMQIAMFLEDIETSSEAVPVYQLVEMMETIIANETSGCDKTQAYSVPYMKKKLQEHFGESVVITETAGKADVVYLKKTASVILRDFHLKQQNSTNESLLLVKTAATLVRNDIIAEKLDTSVYPDSGKVEVDSQVRFLPYSLQILLSSIIKGKDSDLKIASIGQAIMQAARPKTCVAPLQVNLAIHMHKSFASRHLIDTLNALGFCSSYAEVLRFWSNAAATLDLELPALKEGDTLQFVCDNVDHNTATLDGKDTFHGMGMIAVLTPGRFESRQIPRKQVNSSDISVLAKVDINFYRSDRNELASIMFKDLNAVVAEDKTEHLNTLWKISWPLKAPRPSWNGLMQETHEGVHPGKSEVFFLPMLDLSTNDMTCVYSTLVFVSKQAQRYGVTPVVTFDQPLYMKAQAVVSNEGHESCIKSVVLQLGHFHTQMSFLGSIGHLMSGSGLQEALELIYAPAVVPHIMNGKAHSRAVRAHLLMDAALNALLTAAAYDMSWILVQHEHAQSTNVDYPATTENNPTEMDERNASLDLIDTVSQDALSPRLNTLCNESRSAPRAQEHPSKSSHSVSVCEHEDMHPFSALTQSVDEGNQSLSNTESVPSTATQTVGNEDLDEAAELLDQLMSGQLSAEDACRSPSLVKISAKLDDFKQSLSTDRTARLWLMYLELIDVLKMSIKAERTGNFYLHLQAVAKMLPFFAASGHHNYAKSARLYLQQMTELQDSNPAVHKTFVEGHNVFRRNHRFWAGLSKDLVIEQVLMKSLKTSGGLTRGSGLKECNRTLWLLSMPACAKVCCQIQELTGISSSGTDKHTEASETRMRRDHADTQVLVSYLSVRNPFAAPTDCLMNISNGRTADPGVNVDSSREIGEQILQGMTNKSIIETKIRKKDQVVTLATKGSAKVREEPIHIDPQLLFQRLVTVAQQSTENVLQYFQYELTNIPAALFDSSGQPREAKKSILADYIWSLLSTDLQQPKLPEEAVNYVLDGGSLLHKLPWQRGSTYKELADAYAEFVLRKYRNATVVFDGYGQASTIKDAAHLRRQGHQGGNVRGEICFAPDMLFNGTKAAFLACKKNKSKLIQLMSESLQEKGVETLHASEDADCLIVKTALKSATTGTTVVVADDTDILVMLLHHTQLECSNIYLVPGTTHSSSKTAKLWNIKNVKTVLKDVCKYLLFAHAIGGCDTVSALYSIGKAQPVKRLKDQAFREHAEVFLQNEATHKVVCAAGEQAVLSLYGGKGGDTLDKMRYVKYMQKISSANKVVQPCALPPTSAATKYHSYRAYLQVQVWKSLSDGTGNMDPQVWGWEKLQGMLFPVYTDQPAAPDDLLSIVRCACKTTCSTTACSCRKHGLICSTGCKNCRGESCMNCMRDLQLEEGTDTEQE